MTTKTISMRLRVCDRCGCKRDLRLPVPDSGESILMRFEEDDHSFVDTAKDYDATRIDLCDTCSALFVDWMRAKGLFK